MENENKEPGKELFFPLPETRPVSERPQTFLAGVDQLLSKLWGVKDFRQFLDALTNKNAVTGNWAVDRGFAAKRIQEEAQKAGLTDIATAKLAKVMRAIETCLRRDHLGRKQRLTALNVQSAE
jgi:hypothetical protein